jgi:hypothetical protein
VPWATASAFTPRSMYRAPAMLARAHLAVATFAVGACICGLRKASSPTMSPATMSAARIIH